MMIDQMRFLMITGPLAPSLRACLTAAVCWVTSNAVSDLSNMAAAQETSVVPAAVFSGPQVGESLPPLIVRGVFDPIAGQEIDLVQQADGKPLVLIFIHDVNRLAVGMARAVSQFTHSRAADGLKTAIILLDDDPTTGEATLKRIRHALTDGVTTTVSIDGREGPGAFGLNRNITLTILIANQGRVTANHAIVQPSLQVDLPKILGDVVAIIKGQVPPIEALVSPPAMRDGAVNPALDLRSLLVPLIRKNATDQEVDQAAAVIEKRIEQDELVRKEIARIATTIANSDKLTNYGTERTQFYLKKWAKELGAPQGADK